MNKIILHNADCIEQLKKYPDNYFGAIITDPPYGLTSIVKRYKKETKIDNSTPQGRLSKGFLGQSWDGQGIEYDPDFWAEIFRVLRWGGYVASFGGSRTYHKMAMAMELAGFNIKDQIIWLYGVGFPKSMNISKAIDAQLLCDNEKGNKINKLEQNFGEGNYKEKHKNFKEKNKINKSNKIYDRKHLKPQTDEAKQWAGFGTQIKPAHEPICIAQKPLDPDCKTIAENVLKWGTGAINIDGTRIAINENLNGGAYRHSKNVGDKVGNIIPLKKMSADDYKQPIGRFPANLITDGSKELEKIFPCNKAMQRGQSYNQPASYKGTSYHLPIQFYDNYNTYNDEGSAMRYFYSAKVSTYERNLAMKENKNSHPTIKPVSLMRYLVKMFSMPDLPTLDPFLGSGSTGIACKLENKMFVGIEKEKEYFDIAQERINIANEYLYKTDFESVEKDPRQIDMQELWGKEN